MQQWTALKGQEKGNDCLQSETETVHWAEKPELSAKTRSKVEYSSEDETETQPERRQEDVTSKEKRPSGSFIRFKRKLGIVCKDTEPKQRFFGNKAKEQGPASRTKVGKAKTSLIQQWNKRKTSRGRTELKASAKTIQTIGFFGKRK